MAAKLARLLIYAKCQRLSVVSAAVPEDQQGLNLSAEVSYQRGVHPLMLEAHCLGFPKQISVLLCLQANKIQIH